MAGLGHLFWKPRRLTRILSFVVGCEVHHSAAGGTRPGKGICSDLPRVQEQSPTLVLEAQVTKATLRNLTPKKEGGRKPTSAGTFQVAVKRQSESDAPAAQLLQQLIWVRRSGTISSGNAAGSRNGGGYNADTWPSVHLPYAQQVQSQDFNT